MQETTEQPTLAPEAVNGLTEAAARAQDWAGEPFLRADEDPAVVLAPGTARRLALDDAVEEMVEIQAVVLPWPTAHEAVVDDPVAVGCSPAVRGCRRSSRW